MPRPMRVVGSLIALVASLVSLPAAACDTLPTSDHRMVSIETEIVGHDGFDQSLSSDAKTRDAAWVVRQLEQFHPSASPTIKTINVYAALEPREGGYFGNFTTAT